MSPISVSDQLLSSHFFVFNFIFPEFKIEHMDGHTYTTRT